MKRIVMVSALLMALPVHAELFQCQNVTFTDVTVEGPRDDGFVLQNKLVVKFSPACGGMERAHLSIADPLFNGFLSIALVIKTTGGKADIAVNTSEQTSFSNKLAYISIPQ